MFTALCAIAAWIWGFTIAGMIAGRRIAGLKENIQCEREVAQFFVRLWKACDNRIAHAKSMDTPHSNATVKRILRALDGE
jgi:hypothetical protein